MTTYEIVISDEQDRRVCTARLTCLIRDMPTE
jgi:acyl-coenzyme A thioesterase PaaI-like protein